MGAIPFSPSFEDALTIKINDGDVIFGEDDLAALVGKWAQADKGMGK
jgi:hypothetical protein